MIKHALALALGLAVVGSAGVGCTSTFTKGTPILEYQKGKAPRMQEAPTDGEYVLMSSMLNTTPKATLWLEQGDALGFKESTTGKIIAVGGDEEIELPDGSYIWKRRPGATPRATTQGS